MTVEHHVAALTIAATAVVMVAADVAESVGGWAADGSKIGVIGAGMAIAYKITAKANAEHAQCEQDRAPCRKVRAKTRLYSIPSRRNLS